MLGMKPMARNAKHQTTNAQATASKPMGATTAMGTEVHRVCGTKGKTSSGPTHIIGHAFCTRIGALKKMVFTREESSARHPNTQLAKFNDTSHQKL
jgi:hypothetical protein